MASRDHDNQDELLLFVMRRTGYTWRAGNALAEESRRTLELSARASVGPEAGARPHV
ncbi:MAG: hypothetical protein JWN13_3470 [Betaproteobacteria bacterium]|jgi:hypothetical protein|nr:hypothetical protein [Betaproteobacteria bacterium]